MKVRIRVVRFDEEEIEVDEFSDAVNYAMRKYNPQEMVIDPRDHEIIVSPIQIKSGVSIGDAIELLKSLRIDLNEIINHLQEAYRKLREWLFPIFIDEEEYREE